MPRNDTYRRRLERYGNARLRVLELMMYSDYQQALVVAIGKYKDFIDKLDDVTSGRYKPPDYYVEAGEEAVERWKRGFVTELMRRGRVVEGIAQELNRAGRSMPDYVRDAMADIYTFNHEAMLARLEGQAGVKLGIAGVDTAAARLLYQANETPLTRISYQRYANQADIEERLRREFMVSLSTGENTKKLVERVHRVTDGQTTEEYLQNGRDPLLKACKSVVRYEMMCARRIAQTERTRVQSQAGYDASQKVADAGVRIVNEWSCQNIPPHGKSSGSRDTHIDLDGQKRPQGVAFDLMDGDRLMYPGDPNGRACNVINCHCTLIPSVLLPGETM